MEMEMEMEDVKEIIRNDIAGLEKYQKDLETAEFVLRCLRRDDGDKRFMLFDAFLSIAEARKKTNEDLERFNKALTSIEPNPDDKLWPEQPF